jgi:hypothetical protein
VRGGYLRASGDDEPLDDRHGTFFAILPTVRQYARSALYSQMNNTDLFAQLLARPRTNMNVRLDWHRVGLATSSDGWYYGSGATQEHGTIFGFATRPSFGATHLATIGEGSVDYAIAPHWSVDGYLGWHEQAASSSRHLPGTRSRSHTSRTYCSFDESQYSPAGSQSGPAFNKPASM